MSCMRVCSSSLPLEPSPQSCSRMSTCVEQTVANVQPKDDAAKMRASPCSFTGKRRYKMKRRVVHALVAHWGQERRVTRRDVWTILILCDLEYIPTSISPVAALCRRPVHRVASTSWSRAYPVHSHSLMLAISVTKHTLAHKWCEVIRHKNDAWTRMQRFLWYTSVKS